MKTGTMLSWEEKVKLKEFISDTVRWMCKDGLMHQLTGDFCVEGLIGVTVGRDELLMVGVYEIFIYIYLNTVYINIVMKLRRDFD